MAATGKRGGAKLFRVVEPEEAGEGEGDHHQEDRADKAAAAGDHEMGAEFAAEELTGGHREAGAEVDEVGDEEEGERGEVAGGVHDFRERGGAGEILTEHEDQGDGPERAGAGAEETVVETKREAEADEEERGGELGRVVFGSDLGAEERVEKDGGEEPGDEVGEEVGVDLLHGEGAEERAGECRENSETALAERDGAAAEEMDRGGDTAEAGLKFIGAEGEGDGKAEIEERGDGDESAAAGDGVHRAGDEADEEEDGIVPEFEGHWGGGGRARELDSCS
mgnify:CR=1 FL=1